MPALVSLLHGMSILSVMSEAQYTDGSGFYKWHTDGFLVYELSLSRFSVP